MEMVGRLSLLIKLSRAMAICVLVASCTQPALKLPADYGSIDAGPLDASMFESSDLELSCSQIVSERVALKDQRSAIRNNIVASREGDQFVGYIASVAFPPLWLAVDSQSQKKSQIRQVEQRIDTLTRLVRYNSCLQDAPKDESPSSFEAELDQLTALREEGSITREEYEILRLAAFRKHYPEMF